MDSLTQITLGAAMGELTLGKRIGNRALVWGAIAGTIPDLDVVGGLFMTEIDALAFHRGPTHALLFAVTTPWIFGWLVDRWYSRGIYANLAVRTSHTVLRALAVLSLVFIALWSSWQGSWPWFMGTGLAVALGIRFLLPWIQSPRNSPPLPAPDASYLGWVKLFFWAILTHPILDAFTSYGTQLLLPFSDERVAFNAIAVVDPLYTLPFLAALIWAARYAQNSPLRRNLVVFGLGWSCLYLGLCTINKWNVDRVFASSLRDQGIEASRFTTSPSIFNNILWSGVAETPTHFYLGTYSLFDEEARITDFTPLEKPSTPIPLQQNDPTWGILRWFSNGYFLTEERPEGSYNFYDLRYGGVPGEQAEHSKRFIFAFHLEEGMTGWTMKQQEPERREVAESFRALWLRLKGYSTEALGNTG